MVGSIGGEMIPEAVVRPERSPIKEFPEESEWDVAIIGAGPNGLILGAYLARAGAKVIVLERRNEIGGGLATEEILFPCYYSNVHAVYHLMVEYMPPLMDFKLQKHGLQFISPNFQTAMVFQDGSSLLLCRMIEDTKDSIAKFSDRDAAKFGELMRKYRKLVDELIAPATYLPVPPPAELTMKLEREKLGRDLLKLSEDSPYDVINRWFRDERVKTLLLYITCMWGISPKETGLGYLIPLYIDRAMNRSICYGGSHRLAASLAREILSSGGMVLDTAEVRRICMEDEEAKGVELFDGRKINASAVVSSLDPQTTFLKLVGEENLPRDFSESIRGWQWESWSFFTLHVALEHPPIYKTDDPWVNEALMVVLGFESQDDVLKFWENVEKGEIDRIGGHATCETLFDPTLSRIPRKHVAFFQLHAPYDIKGGWEERKEEVAEKVIERWEEYAPGLRENIILSHAESPLDIERRIPAMVRGSIKHGAYTPLQMGYFRPNDSCSSARTPVKNLYLCGASMYPGGLVTGGPGYIAAGIIADDLNLDRWWSLPSYIRRYQERYLE
jgi:phytoene dehydrogenase-like protein